MARKVKQRFGLNGYIALYAPTFRGDRWKGYQTDFHFPYRTALSALEKRTGKPAVILKRAHLGSVMSETPADHVIDVTDYPYMQELLCVADLLITDYSSCMWDYALLGRPCLLYAVDADDYERERGFSTPMREWPGIVCRNEDELLYAIETFDEEACAEMAMRHLHALGSYETGRASEQVCEQIMRFRNAQKKDVQILSQ